MMRGELRKAASILAGLTLVVGGATTSWARHGDPAVIRYHKDQGDSLIGQRPAARANVDAARGALRAGRHHFNTVERPTLRANGASKVEIRWHRRQEMVPLRANLTKARGALGEMNAGIGYHRGQVQKLTTHPHKDHDGPASKFPHP